MQIRPELPSDLSIINALLNQAFGQNSESLLVQELRSTDDFIKKFSFVLEEGNQILGYLLLYPITIKHDHGTISSLALAPMAVSPKKQRKGFGGLLVKHAIASARVAKWGSIVVLGHSEYYPKFGFERASKWNISCPFEVPDEVFMAIELTPGSLTSGGKVLYPAPFMQV